MYTEIWDLHSNVCNRTLSMAWLHSPHPDGKVRGGWHGCPTHHWPASSLQTPPRSSAATCSAERWERSSEHVVDGLATLGASTLTVPTGRVATAPLLLPYKPAAAAMRMHLAGDAAVHVITGQQHGNCCHFSSRPSFEAGFVSSNAARADQDGHCVRERRIRFRKPPSVPDQKPDNLSGPTT